MFVMLNQNHSCNARPATYHFLDIAQVKSTNFRQHSLKFESTKACNNLQRTQNLDLLTSEPSEFKKHCSRLIFPNTAITPKAIY